MAITKDQVAFHSAKFADANNRIGRPVKSNSVFVPEDVRLEGNKLAWAIPQMSSERNWTWATDRIIAPFVKLADAQPDAIVEFARRYGVFGACQIPRDAPKQDNEILFRSERWRVSTGLRDGPEWEPVELWRQFSRTARAMLLIAAQLNDIPPKPGDPVEWRILGVDFDPNRDQVEDAQFLLWCEVNNWLEAGRVGLRMWPRNWSKLRTLWETEIHLGGGYRLFGALALQMMLVIAGKTALYTCSGCRLPYIPAGRRPKRGHNSYCDDCGLERARQDADRRRKDKMIEARRLAAEGIDMKEIALRLNVRSVRSIRRWLKAGQLNGVKKRRIR
jgi:hypothetical protein